MIKKHEQTVERLKGIVYGKTEREHRGKERAGIADKPALLLSNYLQPGFIMPFERVGFPVLHINHFPLMPSVQVHVLKHLSDPAAARLENVNGQSYHRKDSIYYRWNPYGKNLTYTYHLYIY